MYRRLWGWPLRSPKHLVAATVGLVVVIAAVGFFLPEQSSQPASSRYSAAHSAEYQPAPTQSSTDEASPPSFSVPQAAPPPTAPDPAGLQSAHAWARAWVTHPEGLTKREWLERLRPRTSPEFLPEMESVSLDNVPTKVMGPPKPAESTGKSMTVRVPTDGGEIMIMLVNTPDGWQVAGYDKAV